MFSLREVVLLCSIFLCLSSAKGQKDDTGCEVEGRPGVCVEWDKCAYIKEILQRSPPIESELIYAQKLKCYTKRHVPYYCCISGMPAQPEAPPPQTQVTSNRSVVNKYDEGDVLQKHRNRKLIPMETCGQIVNRYIIGGEQALLGEYPWIAAIHYVHIKENARFMCGGALINKHYVLTAAHCLHPSKLSGFFPDFVRLGEHNFETNPDRQRGKEGRYVEAYPVIDFMLDEKIIHANYNAWSSNKFHDIGLIRLKGQAQETRYVLPICLPTPDVESKILSSNDVLQVAGWGNTESGSASTVLMKVLIPPEDLNSCRTKYPNLNLSVTQMCAGRRGKDSCQGDSGGPLIGLESYSNYNLRFFAVGLVSYGPKQCGVYDLPGVYTRVLPYVGWILDNIKP